MNRSSFSARLIGLSLLALILFMPPVVLIFDKPTKSGLSFLPIYIFSAWLGIILLAAWLLEQRHEE